jgi:hypothetical protein
MGRRPARRPNPFRQGSGRRRPGADTHVRMELAGLTQREKGLDLIAAHLAGLDSDVEPARHRLEHAIGADLATLLVAALSKRSMSQLVPRPATAVAA